MTFFCAAMVCLNLFETTFSEEADVFAQTMVYCHAIELEATEQPPYKPIYNLREITPSSQGL